MNFNEIRDSLLGPDLNKGLQVCVLLVLATVRDVFVAKKTTVRENCTRSAMCSQTKMLGPQATREGSVLHRACLATIVSLSFPILLYTP